MTVRKDAKPILLTGSHRSGTTWVAKMIAASKSVGLIMEPFNDVNHRPGVFNIKFGCFFPYISFENQALYLEAFKDTIEFRYNLVEGLKAIRSIKDSAKVVRDYFHSFIYSLQNRRPLIKDPNVVFMAEWLSDTFEMDVIILIRHPAAFVSSLLVLNWAYPFSQLLEKPLLMRDHLHPFEEEIQNYANQEYDLVDQGILLWRIIHYMISTYINNKKEWIFLRHEDVSRDPLHEFSDIFNRLDMEFSKDVKKNLEKFTNASNPKDSTSIRIALSSARSIRRDSRSNIWNWKKRLSTDVITYIRSKTEDISTEFYSDRDW